MKHRKLAQDLWQLMRRYDWPLAVVATTSLVMILAVPVTRGLLPGGRDLTGPILKMWAIWDANTYLLIAQHGYQTVGDAATFIAFLPLLPFLIWLVHWVTLLDFTAAGYLVALVGSILSACLLHDLVLLDDGRPMARRAVLFLFLFPASIFLHLPYTESLFLALVLGIFLCLRKGRFGFALALAALVTATRMQGLVIIPVLLAELLLYNQSEIKKRPYLLVLAVAVPCIGFGVYTYINFAVFGSALHFLQVEQTNWSQAATFPWQGFMVTLGRYADWQGINAVLLVYAQLAAALLGLAAVVYAALRLRLSYSLYAIGILFMSTATGFWVSVPRYVVVIFPIYIMLAHLTKRRLVYWLALAITSALWLGAVLIGVEHGNLF